MPSKNWVEYREYENMNHTRYNVYSFVNESINFLLQEVIKVCFATLYRLNFNFNSISNSVSSDSSNYACNIPNSNQYKFNKVPWGSKTSTFLNIMSRDIFRSFIFVVRWNKCIYNACYLINSPSHVWLMIISASQTPSNGVRCKTQQ